VGRTTIKRARRSVGTAARAGGIVHDPTTEAHVTERTRAAR